LALSVAKLFALHLIFDHPAAPSLLRFNTLSLLGSPISSLPPCVPYFTVHILSLPTISYTNGLDILFNFSAWDNSAPTVSIAFPGPATVPAFLKNYRSLRC
jgi:hypothetical protein